MEDIDNKHKSEHVAAQKLSGLLLVITHSFMACYESVLQGNQ